MTDNILHAPAMYRDMTLTAMSELSNKLPQDDVEAVARKIADRFCRAYNGRLYRVPNLQRADKISRDKEIRMQIKTMNIKDIARKHGLSVRTVRGIVSNRNQS